MKPGPPDVLELSVLEMSVNHAATAALDKPVGDRAGLWQTGLELATARRPLRYPAKSKIRPPAR